MMRMPFSSTVLVYEFYSGGGCPEGELPAGLPAEALGMLWAALQDFRNWGAVRTITAIDARFERIVPGLDRHTLPADKVVCALPGNHEDVYLSILKECDAVLIIAPETDGILAWLTAQAEAEGKCLLCSCSTAVAAAGNKATTGRLFDLANLPAPETRTASFFTAAHVASRMRCPLVLKPLDGVGSEGVCRLDRLSDLPGVLAVVRRSTSQEQIILQSLARGIHASVSLLVGGGRCLPLSLNLQLIDSGVPFQYRGSRVPFYHPAGDRAMDLAAEAAKLIPGLNGYVGVDLVMGEDALQLIEINPRLTTSYIGLRQVSRVNLAEAIWIACRDGLLPDRIALCGQVTITKNDPASWNLGTAKD
jgi:tyramine---L-glutamate ligase